MNPHILILNGTCLDVFDDHRAWVESQGVDAVAESRFRGLSRADLAEVLRNAHAVVGPAAAPILPSHMASNCELQVISLACSGFEYIDIEAATRNGIVVANAPVREGAEVVADHTWALLLAVARQIPYHNRLLQQRRCERGMGVAVYGKTLGVLGLGHIGKAVARRAGGFDMQVLATEIAPDNDFIGRHGIELVPLEELLERADFVSLHLRIGADTEGIIGAAELALMKRSAFLIDTARSRLVNEEALTAALLAGQIAGAAMDDPPEREDSPLVDMPNFVCTPHLGNRAIEGVQAVTRCALQNAIDVIQGRRSPYVLNPEVYDSDNLRAPRPD